MYTFRIHAILLPQRTVRVLCDTADSIEADSPQEAIREMVHRVRAESRHPRGRVRILSIDWLAEPDATNPYYRSRGRLDPHIYCVGIAGALAGNEPGLTPFTAF
jgi:hypothetical protein